VWTALVGYDAGLEQQVFQLLEHSPFGWDALTEVETSAERDVTEQLRSAANR
jgi:hypothetical protein